MPKFRDLTGQRFGRLSVIERAENGTDYRGTPVTRWRCQCDCGREVITLARSLASGETTSCGCAGKEHREAAAKAANTKHGGTHHRGNEALYNTWLRMKDRCRNPNACNWKYYGGRGIAVCSEWQTDYSAFRVWALSHGYEKGLSIDRIDPDGNYCPENCRWITMAEQQRNKRNMRRSPHELS